MQQTHYKPTYDLRAAAEVTTGATGDKNAMRGNRGWVRACTAVDNDVMKGGPRWEWMFSWILRKGGYVAGGCWQRNYERESAV